MRAFVVPAILLALVGLVFAAPATSGTLLLAFDTTGTVTHATTAVPYETVTAYLILHDPEITDPINAWECTVEITTSGPAPVINWQVANDGLNIVQPPEFIVGLPHPLLNDDYVVLATATILVEDPGSEIEFRLLSSPYPSSISPPGYPIELPDWAGPPGNPFHVVTPASGCPGEPVAWINDNYIAVPQQITTDDDASFGAVAVGGASVRTVTLINTASVTTCGRLILTGEAYSLRHGHGDWTAGPVWCRLDPGESLDLQVRFQPPTSGPHYGEIILEGCGPLLALSLTGGGGEAPPVDLDPSELEYGVVVLDETVDAGCTVRNDGTSSLDFAPAVVEGDAFALVDTAPFTLGAGQSRVVTARFAATSEGPHLGRVALGQSLAPDLLLRGTARQLAGQCVTTLDGNGQGDCGPVLVGYPITRVVTVSNVGEEPISGTVELMDAPAAFTITSGGGWVELGPGESHEISIEVSPPEPGTFTATLFSLGGCGTVHFRVLGVPAILACEVTPPALDFGVVIIDSTAVGAVTVRNTGTLLLALDPSLPEGPFTIIAGGEATTLAPGDTLRVAVVFTPPAAAPYAAALTLGADACADVACAGTGRPWGGVCVVEPEVLDFGDTAVNIPVMRDLIVSNQGIDAFTVDPVLASPVFTIVVGGGPHLLVPGAQWLVRVRFAADEVGDYAAELNLQAGACPGVPVIATATPAVVACDWNGATAVDWGDRQSGGMFDETVVYRNVGNLPLLEVAFTVTGGGFALVSGEGPVDLAPGETHEVGLRFTPLDSVVYSGGLQASLGGCSPLPLLGHGLPASALLTVDPPLLEFGQACEGQSRDLYVTLQHPEGHAIVVFPQVTGQGFEIVDHVEGEALVVPPGPGTYLLVRFTAPPEGAYAGEVSFGLFYTTTVPLAAITGAPGPQCAVDAEALDFGEVGIGFIGDRQLRVVNDGCAPLPITPAVSGPGFLIFSGGAAGEIGPGGTRTLVVRFAPQEPGAAAGWLDLGTPDCPVISLAGYGVEAPVTCYTLPAYLNVDFLPPSRQRTKMFAIYNGGGESVPLDVENVAGLADVIAGGGSFYLQPGETRVVQATFHAPAYGQTIWQWNLGAGCRPLTVVVYGADAICHVRPAFIDFGTVPIGSQVVRNWVVSNPGIATVTYTVGCDDPNYTWSPTGTRTLLPGYSYSGLVTFVPQAAGTHAARLEFNSETAYPIDLRGIAVASLATKRFDVTHLDFGPVSPGESLTRSCLLRNESEETLSGEVTLTGSEFRLVDGSGNVTVPPGGSRAIRVRYVPQQVGDHQAVVALAGTDLPQVVLVGRCYVAPSDSNRVAIVWDDGAPAREAQSDLYHERELTGRLVLREPMGTTGLFAWQGRLIASGDGRFTAWQLPAGATNLVAAPAFQVVVTGDIPPLVPEITLATFRYLVPAGGAADFRLAAVAGEEPLGWPAWQAAAEPDSVLVAPSLDGDHLVAMIRPDGDQVVPGLVQLHPPYPNPFNPMVTVAFDLGEAGQAKLEIYDLAGRRVTTLVEAVLSAGRHEFVWRGRNDGGDVVPSGTYHVRLLAGGQMQTHKLSLLK